MYLFAYNPYFNSLHTFCIVACCELPYIDNGAFGGNGCAEGATILIGVACKVNCDDNHMASVPSVTCVGAGKLDDEPMCQGMMFLNTYVAYK